MASRSHRFFVSGVVRQIGTDVAGWTIAIFVAVILRYEFDLARLSLLALAGLCVVTALVQTVSGLAMQLYRSRHPSGSFAEARALLVSTLVTAALVGVPLLFTSGFEIPRSTLALAAPIAFVVNGGARYVKRVRTENSRRPAHTSERTLVFGAGYLGAAVIRRMLTDTRSPYLPVGLIDDDPAKRNVRLDNVRVLGPRDSISDAAHRTSATLLVIAVAKADAPLLRAISDAATAAGLRVKVFPMLDELLEGRSRLGDLRDISIEDLVGRHPVNTEVESIAGYLTGKRVLVTGAGGSIGSELCRQIARFEPAELIMIDHDETGLQGTQLSISGHGLLDTREVVLGSIRDSAAMLAIFVDRRPQVVFHAAALKHLPMLEQYPEEAWKSNVLGTRNVLQASLAVGVETFINISTDKAASPTSALGHSKRVAERLTSWAAGESGNCYLSVRFGNVIGSRGSMLPTFASVIEAGGPLTITHRDVTRFFMTIPEACQLVMQAGGIGRPAEVLILDMGEPVRIMDVATRMIEMSGKTIEIVFTGLRKGEKLHEQLIGPGESDDRPVHPKISHTAVPPISPDELSLGEWLRQFRATSVSAPAETLQ